ncbi:hypothetical protein RchiOBHm_Chr0c30g0501211 [Rosa chinensis]|uniref:Uncharacterized protein n=1 Tax=Rosa chinensis TaxID=74649 RepID=A0A2P6SQC7_ROSCH|nr:hypothetical protein RchiOBHm_Chr0c30g0501211 [Rosa chinensis]
MGLHGQSEIMGMGFRSQIEFKGSLSELFFLFLLYIYWFSIPIRVLKNTCVSVPLSIKSLSLWFSAFQKCLVPC